VTAGIFWRKILIITGYAALFIYKNIVLLLLGQLSPTISYLFLLQANCLKCNCRKNCRNWWEPL